MNDNMQQLKLVLQTLALPVIGQVRLVEEDCLRVDLLAETFNAAHDAVRRVPERLTPAQVTALTRLDNQLAWLRREASPPLCSELAMRESRDWRQVRAMAREALVRFNWTLAIPPQEVSASP